MERPQILWVARSYALPKSGVKRHNHPYFHIFYITAGECYLATGSETHVLHSGQSLLVPRQMEHAYWNENSSVMEFLEIKFSLPNSALDTQLLSKGVQTSDSPLVGMLFEQVLNKVRWYW